MLKMVDILEAYALSLIICPDCGAFFKWSPISMHFM